MPANDVKTVAVFNASDDTVELLSDLLSQHGHRAIPGHVDQVKSGETDFMAFLQEQRPDAIIWDISPPYDRNWNFAKMVRGLRILEGCVFVVTTTHKAHLDKLAKEDTGAHEIIGKPYDLGLIIEAVERGFQQMATKTLRAVDRGTHT